MKNSFFVIASPKKQARNDTESSHLTQSVSLSKGDLNCATDNRLTEKRAQSMFEYIILVGVATIVMFAMFPAMKRGIQGMTKLIADQVGNQQNSDQRVTPTSGYLVGVFTATKSNIHKDTRELLGNYDYIHNEGVRTFSTSLVNLGFTNREGMIP